MSKKNQMFSRPPNPTDGPDQHQEDANLTTPLLKSRKLDAMLFKANNSPFNNYLIDDEIDDEAAL